MPDPEQQRPLIGAVIIGNQIKPAIPEDTQSGNLVEAATPHILRVIEDRMDSGGVTVKSAQTMSGVKRALGSALQPVVARYDMACLMAEGGDAPDTLTEDLVSTAYRAAAINIIFASLLALDSDTHSDLIERVDRISYDLHRRSSDAHQISYLKRPVVAYVLFEAAGEVSLALNRAANEYASQKATFAEPTMFNRICLVFRDAGMKLGVFAGS